ncbi:MAG: hypothetical protein OXH09_23365 [Gammaproteobacteria bacterium]|nr:hypothetical protein [Gammaproteobacteria bacterium]
MPSTAVTGVFALSLLLAIAGSGARAQPAETESDPWGAAWSELIRKELPDFANVKSDEEARAVVRDAISSDDPKVLEETFRQIGFIAMLASVQDMMLDIQEDFAKSQLRQGSLGRRFSNVPGLRGHLIDFLRSGAEQTRHWTDPEAEYASLSDAERRRLDTWSLAWAALAACFPQDPVVHDVLIDAERADPDHGMALVLFVGRFRSDAADEIYVAALDGDPGIAVVAAKGLALSGSDAALAALMRNLDRRDAALVTVVQAITTLGTGRGPMSKASSSSARN